MCLCSYISILCAFKHIQHDHIYTTQIICAVRKKEIYYGKESDFEEYLLIDITSFAIIIYGK